MSLLDRLRGKPSQARFARDLMAAFREAGDPRSLVYDADQNRLVDSDGGGVVNLANLYMEHCATPRGERKLHLQQIAASFVAAADELPEDFEEVRENLRPKVWSRAAIHQMELHARLHGDPPPDIPVYPLGDHLYSSIVYDLPHSMRSLTREQLENWGVSYYEALEAACHNLEEATIAWASIGEHLHSAVSGDSYDSARALLLDRIRGFDSLGDPVAVIPNRDTMMVAGIDDEESLGIMLAMTKRALEEEARPLCPLPLRLVDGQWESWMPPEGHPHADEFRQLETQFLGELYHEQKELLDQIHEREGDDVFVASFSGVQKKGEDRVISYCVWGENVHALLPQAEFVVLVGDDGIAASGRWDHVMAVVGDLVAREDDFYPTRYRVRQYPSDEQLQRIGVAEEFAP